MVDSVTVACQECGVQLAADSPELRLELTCDDEPLFYCVECWQREFGASAGRLIRVTLQRNAFHIAQILAARESRAAPAEV